MRWVILPLYLGLSTCNYGVLRADYYNTFGCRHDREDATAALVFSLPPVIGSFVAGTAAAEYLLSNSGQPLHWRLTTPCQPKWSDDK